MGADYIEPDLVATSDGRLIARHEPNITSTTNVGSHPEFADRKRTAIVDGAAEEGWFASDFTLAEIKTLRAVQPLAERPQQFNGLYEIPTFEEVLALAESAGEARGRPVGVYPETKHPTYHADLGLPLEGPLVAALRDAGLNHADSPVFIQSFEQGNLQRLNRMTPVRLVQLVDANDIDADGNTTYAAPFDRPYDWTASGKKKLLDRTFNYFTTDAGLKEVAKYADGLGPWKVYIQSTALRDINGDGTIGDENGDDAGQRRATARWSRRRRSSTARMPRACSSTRGRSATRRAGSPTTTAATRSTSTPATSRSAWTASSPTSRTPRWRRATPSSAADHRRGGGRVASAP